MSSPCSTTERHTSRTPRAPCHTHSSRPLHNATLGNSRGRPGPLGSGPAPWRSSLAARPCKQRCTYVATCSTKPALVFAWPDRLGYMRGSSFHFYIHFSGVSSLILVLTTPPPIFWILCGWIASTPIAELRATPRRKGVTFS